ncbi:transcription elongation factor spt5 [Paramarasmius palmivorus]|uniref:Transcription elongation factor spt5 n=1 Tax=Paramarasmius palmivorus TaxID=297713 RepID=A0AAW0DWU0_9AGAR
MEAKQFVEIPSGRDLREQAAGASYDHPAITSYPIDSPVAVIQEHNISGQWRLPNVTHADEGIEMIEIDGSGTFASGLRSSPDPYSGVEMVMDTRTSPSMTNGDFGTWDPPSIYTNSQHHDSPSGAQAGIKEVNQLRDQVQVGDHVMSSHSPNPSISHDGSLMDAERTKGHGHEESSPRNLPSFKDINEAYNQTRIENMRLRNEIMPDVSDFETLGVQNSHDEIPHKGFTELSAEQRRLRTSQAILQMRRDALDDARSRQAQTFSLEQTAMISSRRGQVRKPGLHLSLAGSGSPSQQPKDSHEHQPQSMGRRPDAEQGDNRLSPTTQVPEPESFHSVNITPVGSTADPRSTHSQTSDSQPPDSALILRKLHEMHSDMKQDAHRFHHNLDAVRSELKQDIRVEVDTIRMEIGKRAASETPVEYRRQRRKKRGPYVTALLPKQRSEDHNEFVRLFRSLMNKYLNISRDEAIWKVFNNEALSASIEEVTQFCQSDGNGPDITKDKCLRIFWDTLEDCAWNRSLCYQFTAHFTSEFPVYDTEKGREKSERYFWQRLHTLRDTIKARLPRQGETDSEALRRYNGRKVMTRKRMRQQTRRDEIFKRRHTFAWEMAANQTLTRDHQGAWRNLAIVIDKMGSGAISSDESDRDEDEPLPESSTICRVRIKPWRNKRLTAVFQYLDTYGTRTSVYGNRAPGNQPHTRHRSKFGQLSRRRAIAGLPITCYDENWLKGRTPDDMRYLAPTAPIELPHIKSDE